MTYPLSTPLSPPLCSSFPLESEKTLILEASQGEASLHPSSSQDLFFTKDTEGVAVPKRGEENFPFLAYLQEGSAYYYPLKSSQVRIGRASENEICLKGVAGISRVHCQLFREGDFWYLEDCGSCNGTFYEEIRLAGGTRQKLTPNTSFRLGDFSLSFSVPSLPTPPPFFVSLLLKIRKIFLFSFFLRGKRAISSFSKKAKAHWPLWVRKCFIPWLF
jgi:hypothetical protein